MRSEALALVGREGHDESDLAAQILGGGVHQADDTCKRVGWFGDDGEDHDAGVGLGAGVDDLRDEVLGGGEGANGNVVVELGVEATTFEVGIGVECGLYGLCLRLV